MSEKPTMPPGPEDIRALEHAKRIREIDDANRERGASGLLRALAEGWAAMGRTGAL